MQQRIWLIGGTGESAELAKAIAQMGLPCIVTVATESARRLYCDLVTPPPSELIQIQVGRLQPDGIDSWIQARTIGCILDASHPFAVEVSQMAIATAQTHQLPYLRFERPTPPLPSSQCIQEFPALSTILDSDMLQGQRVLLTLGYRFLASLQPWQERATLFARILPSQTALAEALAAGFTPDRLIALRPPISMDLERALWQQWQISLVITKASGIPGGEEIKRKLAAELGVTLAVISRPAIAYPHQTSDIQTAIEFCMVGDRR
jgi:precorrin-6A/cobalt-precorrin-6A reductase